MRQKKIKAATIENLNNLGVLMHQTPIHVDPKKFITLEVGSGKGQFISSLAHDFQDEVFIAVEREQNVCYRLAQKKDSLKLDNLVIIMDDALHLEHYLFDMKVDKIYLNFSDPWPKVRQHKRRLTYPTMLERFKKLLKLDGQIILRTDHVDLFVDSYQYFIQAGFKILDCIWDLPESKYMTEYEVKKRSIGPIYQLITEVADDKSL